MLAELVAWVAAYLIVIAIPIAAAIYWFKRPTVQNRRTCWLCGEQEVEWRLTGWACRNCDL